MKKVFDIAVVPGDGTGPEVVDEGIKVLKAVSKKCDFDLKLTPYNLGGEHYAKTGEILSDETLDAISKHEAIYLGAIGHPDVKPGILEKGILLTLRFELD